jgi:CheY-like chemotaxis protein
MRRVALENKRILHVGTREIIIELRDRILRLHGFEVQSTLFLEEAPALFERQPFDLVLVDVEGQGRVSQAEELCAEIRELHPRQKVAFVCNYQVSIESDCPDDIIEAEFNPEACVEGVMRTLE